ncbi:hypothetical protein ACFR9U_05140 [Halorientalis brevis]|uniref:Uncharacterized protein n=1 Tax=Halorientalis brevis TaxID=1126241 RepID=A0ABD6C8H0_9EURY|nr:hypothetical protein [Halorientalis brevis]
MGLFGPDEHGSEYEAQYDVADDPPDGASDDAEEADKGPALTLAHIHDEHVRGTIKRVVDHEAGVMLYCYNHGSAGGIAAVPLSETDFEMERE